jgi:hypothetical protein
LLGLLEGELDDDGERDGELEGDSDGELEGDSLGLLEDEGSEPTPLQLSSAAP